MDKSFKEEIFLKEKKKISKSRRKKKGFQCDMSG
jgi:hypothetical protein